MANADPRSLARPPARRKAVLVALYLALVVAAATLIAVTSYILASRASVVAPAGEHGEALIGGPFDLVDHFGRPVTESVLNGQVSLVYFGYTHCPDYCPTELANLVEAERRLEATGVETQVIFVSVDPERDTPERLAEYVPLFSRDALGLTGTPAQVQAAMDQYRVIARIHAPDANGWRAVDHSLFVYAMDETGAFVTHFGPNTDPAVIAARLAP